MLEQPRYSFQTADAALQRLYDTALAKCRGNLTLSLIHI